MISGVSFSISPAQTRTRLGNRENSKLKRSLRTEDGKSKLRMRQILGGKGKTPQYVEVI